MISTSTIDLQIKTIAEEIAKLKAEVQSPNLKRTIEIEGYLLSAIMNVKELNNQEI